MDSSDPELADEEADEPTPRELVKMAATFAVASMVVTSCNRAIGWSSPRHDEWWRELADAAAFGVFAVVVLRVMNAVAGWFLRDDADPPDLESNG